MTAPRGSSPGGLDDRLDAELRPVLAAPRRSRLRWQLAAVAAVVVVVVATGLGLAGNGPVLPSVPPDGSTARQATPATASSSPAPDRTVQPDPGPAVDPAVPCTPRADPGAVPSVTLVADSVSVPGQRDAAALVEALPVRLDDPPPEIRIDGDACAYRWALEADLQPGVLPIDVVANEAGDAQRIRQNRWRLDRLPIEAGGASRAWTMHLRATFVGDVTVDAYWRIATASPPVPDVWLVDADASRARMTVNPCAMEWTSPNGMTFESACTAPIDPPTPLSVTRRDGLRIVADHASVTGWSGSCGIPVAPVSAAIVEPVSVVRACTLGSVIVGGDGVFVARPDQPGVIARLTLDVDGATAVITAYGLVIAGG